ncbi:hypothetical protein [Saliphagus infecundisoli]|uniref:CBS domain-containing protein n=1 Tax=Saliphagus infecundisoli TaxID=1849069 RepID=A0ABD5QI97_9EURY|nr:hypothetical protein [Saliphagus infecundisoli]
MDEAHAKRIPVVNEDGTLAGIIALDNMVVHLAGEGAHVSAQLDKWPASFDLNLHGDD